MVRRKKKFEIEEEKFDWPFEISIKLGRVKPKIAFLSGCERDDPGHSRFSLAYCLSDPEDTAKYNYIPSNNLLPKPISNLGYGIGGLSAPRFARLAGTDTPAPNEYQNDLVPPRVKAKKKVEKRSWQEFVEMYERIVEQQCVKYEAEQNQMEPFVKGGGQKLADTAQTKRDSGQNDRTTHHQIDLESELNFNNPICGREISAFGMGLAKSRFGSDEKTMQTPGVGTYNWAKPSSKRSFQITNSEGKLVPRVRTVCLPGSYDTCLSCGLELETTDYYQTKKKYKIVNKVDTITYGKFKLTYLNLCRSCYCHALKHGHEPWSKDRIPYLFIKARHCSTIHDHQEGHTEYLAKSTYKGMKNLATKELIYSRFFKDTPCQNATEFSFEILRKLRK